MLTLPESFMHVRYVGARYPGAPGVEGIEGGANCQQFAYTILRHFGYSIPDLRSSELWADTDHTRVVEGPLEVFDLLLWHDQKDAWGAHVGLYVGDDHAVHLAKQVGVPVVWPMAAFADHDAYRVFIGAKRVLHQTPDSKNDRDRVSSAGGRDAEG